MLKKYLPTMVNIFEYTRNRIIANIPVENIVTEIEERFSPEILLWNVNNEMLHDFITLIVENSHYCIKHKINAKY